jgi:hypothetical protein
MSELAGRMKKAFDAASPLIESYTEAVCPSCGKVCCIDRHGRYEDADLSFILALDELPAGKHPANDDTMPCRHLSREGCMLPRWKRPYRCTWYFCTRLLETMPADNPRKYRELINALQKLQLLRREFSERS